MTSDVRKSILPASMSAERRRTENFRKEILVLIHRHLQDEGFIEAAEAIEKQAGHTMQQYVVGVIRVGSRGILTNVGQPRPLCCLFLFFSKTNFRYKIKASAGYELGR